MINIAHTKNSLGKRQGLEEHLRNVADATARYSEVFGGEEFARYAGLLHDIGKYDPAFQEYLLIAEQNPGKRMRGPDHKGAGAVLAETFERKGSLAGIVFGHHGGIPSSAKLQTHIREHRTKKPAQDAIITAQKKFPELQTSPHCAVCEKCSVARAPWFHTPRRWLLLTRHSHRGSPPASPSQEAGPVPTSDATFGSHAALLSPSATCQSRISRLPLPSVHNPSATSTTTFFPFRFFRLRWRLSTLTVSVCVCRRSQMPSNCTTAGTSLIGSRCASFRSGSI